MGSTGQSPQPGKEMWRNKNVYEKPLQQFSLDPPTGAYRDGFCRTGPDDKGNHTVAAFLTQEFLDFTTSKGNNLKSVGLKPGQKWCLCASRWKEAMQAAKSESDPIVPKVAMASTAQEALRDVDYKDLKRFAATGETSGAVTGAAPRGMAGANVGQPNVTGGITRDEHPDVGDHPKEAKYPKNYRGGSG